MRLNDEQTAYFSYGDSSSHILLLIRSFKDIWSAAIVLLQFFFKFYLQKNSISGDIQFIEADIVLGTLINDPTNQLQPVMGHPPVTTSDISLDQFLGRILDFNNGQETQHKKGVKLDFKSIEVFEGSLTMLRSLWESVSWLNFWSLVILIHLPSSRIR